MHFQESPDPHKSRYSFIMLPNIEGVSHSTEDSRNTKSVDKLISELSHHQHADRVIDYRDSTLTKALETELGGNCMSKLIVCFNPSDESRVQEELLKQAKSMGQVKNFPVVNDGFSQQLITQYRAGIIHFRKQPIRMSTPAPPPKPLTPVAMPAPLPAPAPIIVHRGEDSEQLRYDNARLLEQVERLQLKLDQLNSKFSVMAQSKSELSAQLVDAEEEKLKATKAYIDMQIQNNKLREEMESSKYELTNRILTLEHDLQLAEIDRQRLSKETSNIRNQMTQLESDRKSLADEYISLKTSYMALTDDCEREAAKNEELTMELLNLINAKKALAQQRESRNYNDELAAMSREEDRIRSLIHRLSHNGITNERLRPDRRQTDQMERELFGDHNRYQVQLDKMKEQYSDNGRQLHEQIDNLSKELSKARSLARERQQKVSFLNARLITMTGENTELKTYNNRLQHKIKDINTEYKLRLTKYVEDISSHIDSLRKEQAEESLAQYVNKLIKDVKVAHRNREEQLSQAAQSYKTRLEGVVRRHEELLCAYRDLRAQVEVLGINDLDLGPDEHELVISDADLHSSQQKEILRLQSELHNAKINKQSGGQYTKDVTGNDRSSSPQGILKKPAVAPAFSNLDSWTSVRKELRNFSEQSLRELEEERAALMTKTIILEEQLKESQDYIDKHLARYKEEINRLRKQLAYKN